MSFEWYYDSDACGLAELVRRKQVSPSDIIAACSQALASAEPLNAIAETYSNINLPIDPGPLYGVPIIRKDLDSEEIDRITSWGSPLGEGLVSESGSYFFSKTRNAGLVSVGRSRVPELGLSIFTESAQFGPTRNPYNLALSPGGSTGGGAALVAAGVVPLAHGSDAGGSLRIPAAWCGLYTLKPSRGRISAAPNGEELLGLNQCFVLARSVRDLETMFDVLNKYEPGEPFYIGFEHQDRSGDSSIKIGIIDTPFGRTPIDPEYKAALKNVAKELEARGFAIENVKVDFDFDLYCEMLCNIIAEGTAADALELSSRTDLSVSDVVQPVVSAWVEYGMRRKAHEVYRTIHEKNLVTRQICRSIEPFDFVIAPVTALPPPSHGHLLPTDITADDILELNRAFEEHIQFCGPFNVSGHPSMSIPVHMHSSGTPIGIQLIGRFGQEVALMNFAKFIGEGRVRRPDFHMQHLMDNAKHE